MKASYFATFGYRGPQEHEMPSGWPTPPVYHDVELGSRNFEEAAETIELADQLGFDWVSFSEHHYGMTLAPHPALAALAMLGRVKRAKLAVMGHALPLNNPVKVAEELAMVDNLSDGRLVVGLLRGTPNEYQVYSVNPGETRDRALESMDLILRAWSEPQPFGWEGRYYQYRTISIWPRLVQQPHPPAFVLGTSRESGTYAAQNRLGLGYSFDRPDLFADQYNHYRSECKKAGWEPSPDNLIYRGRAYVAETDEQAEEDLRLRLQGGGMRVGRRNLSVTSAVAAVDPNPRNPLAGYGSKERRPVLTFYGSPETVARQIKQCKDDCGAGVVDLMFGGPNMEHKQVMRAIELFATKVIPEIRDY